MNERLKLKLEAIRFMSIFISVVLLIIFGAYSCVDSTLDEWKEDSRLHTITWSYVGNTYVIHGDTLDIVGLTRSGYYKMSNGLDFSPEYIKELDPIKGEKY